jgi:hypothetical protein
MVGEYWSAICATSQSWASLETQGVSTPFAELIHRECQKMCGHAVPESYAELGLLQVQSVPLLAKLSGIGNAGRLAKQFPELADQILTTVGEFCEKEPLTSAILSKCIELSAQLSLLAHEKSARLAQSDPSRRQTGRLALSCSSR